MYEKEFSSIADRAQGPEFGEVYLQLRILTTLIIFIFYLASLRT